MKTHFTHVEDIILDRGRQGGLYSIQILEQLIDNKLPITTKWDGCIHPDTLIVTNKGVIPIIDIIQSSESYQVLQYNFTTNKNEMGEIQLSKTTDNNKNWVEVHLENGDILRTTSDHKFYTTNRGWVEAQNLIESDDIKEDK